MAGRREPESGMPQTVCGGVIRTCLEPSCQVEQIACSARRALGRLADSLGDPCDAKDRVTCLGVQHQSTGASFGAGSKPRFNANKMCGGDERPAWVGFIR